MGFEIQAASRQRNLSEVLTALHERGPIRQVDLSDAMSLARTTGISLVEELVDLGLVVSRDAETVRRRGRPSRMIAANDNVVAVAVEVAADTARVDVVGLGAVVRAARNLVIAPVVLCSRPTWVGAMSMSTA